MQQSTVGLWKNSSELVHCFAKAICTHGLSTWVALGNAEAAKQFAEAIYQRALRLSIQTVNPALAREETTTQSSLDPTINDYLEQNWATESLDNKCSYIQSLVQLDYYAVILYDNFLATRTSRASQLLG